MIKICLMIIRAGQLLFLFLIFPIALAYLRSIRSIAEQENVME